MHKSCYPQLLLLCISIAMAGCMRLHHVQIGDIDQTGDYRLEPFDVKVSETGVSIDEARQIAGAFAGQQDRENMGTIGDVIRMFQMGPRTGKNVYTDKYAENVGELLREQCPSGRVTGLIAVRETQDYPVVSGEIVKIEGFCLVRK